MRPGSITFAKNNNLAHEVLRQFGPRNLSSLPVDPEIVIQKKKIDLRLIPRLRQQLPVVAGVIVENSVPSIFIDENFYMTRPMEAPFYLGEELGHIILHGELLVGLERLDDWIVFRDSIGNHTKIEQEARTFASNILFPQVGFGDFLFSNFNQEIDDLDVSTGDEDSIAWEFADSISPGLGVSPFIISYSLRRWPDRVIDRLMTK